MEISVFIDDQWTWLVVIALAINLLVALIFFFPLVLHKPIETREEDLPPLSVIVVARNEFENLQELIPLILTQDYPHFELIIINDRSYDGTHDWLYELDKKEARMNFLSLNDDELKLGPGKKFGLTMGLKRAKHDYVVLLDADCRPMSSQWLKHYGSAFSDEKKVVLGYSPYTSANGTLNLLIRFEGLWVAWQYLSLALLGRPYMGVGRNIGYSKKLFFENGGFRSHQHIAYGDDDLLIQEIATGKNTAILVAEESHVYSIPKSNLKDWLSQKKRHLAASIKYRPFDKFMLSLIWFSQIAQHIGFVLLLLFSQVSIITGSLYLLHFLLWFVFAMVLHIRFKMFKQWWAFPFLQIIYQLIFLPLFSFSGWLNPPKKKW